MFPKSTKAIVANRIKTDQITLCDFLGFFDPSSVNILNTKTAESTEVIKKLINKNRVVIFKTDAKGYCSKKINIEEKALLNSPL